MYKEVKAKVHRETAEGTVLFVLVPNESLTDHLRKYSDSDILDGEIRIDDGRTIRAKQRKKAWAILGDISKYNGDDRDTNHWWLKEMYRDESGSGKFSLSDCSVTTARLYINFLLNFCLLWDIPLSKPIVEHTDDISNAVYATLMHKKCIVCNAPGELHHVACVGMGFDREQIVHLGLRVMCLCRKHHSEAHTVGQAAFDERYHVYGIEADEEICKKWRLRHE